MAEIWLAGVLAALASVRNKHSHNKNSCRDIPSLRRDKQFSRKPCPVRAWEKLLHGSQKRSPTSSGEKNFPGCMAKHNGTQPSSCVRLAVIRGVFWGMSSLVTECMLYKTTMGVHSNYLLATWHSKQAHNGAMMWQWQLLLLLACCTPSCVPADPVSKCERKFMCGCACVHVHPAYAHVQPCAWHLEGA